LFVKGGRGREREREREGERELKRERLESRLWRIEQRISN
jgi:hypothetical protein